MGVFGEKHTSLTREQKRQLIHQADTHKLRPTEVCDWVLATWGLRIARVTVYSILHKQRASLMAGHKDLYNSIQNGNSEDACNGTKYRTSSKRTKSANSSTRSDNDLSHSVLSGEGARWEGQLKRVREPASVELDRAMVQFLKSKEAVDAHGRRLNDAELQSHALRLAREIPSASRMRCSFGWLRHFKRRLGVQWTADRLGRYRWIVEMDPLVPSTADESMPAEAQPSTSANIGMTSAETSASDASHSGTANYATHGKRQNKARQEHDDNKMAQSCSSHSQQYIDELADDDEDEEYHSSKELLGKEYGITTSGTTVRHSRSTSTSTSTPSVPYNNTPLSSLSLGHLQQARRSLDLQQHRHFSFSESSSLSSLGHISSQPLSAPATTLSTQNNFFNLHPSSIPQTSQSQASILDTFPSLFDSQLLLSNPLSNIHTVPSNTTAKLSPSLFGMSVDGGMRKVPSKDEAYEMLQGLLLYYEQDNHYVGEQQTLLLPRWIHQQRQLMQQSDAKTMWVRQQYPSHLISHQQTQTSSLSSSSPTPSTTSYTPHPLSVQSLSHSGYSQALTHRSDSTCSSPPLSPLSAASPITTSISSSPLGSAGASRVRGNNQHCGSDGSAELDHFNVSAAFPSLTSSIEQQLFFAHHHALQQQFAMQQHQHQPSTASPSYGIQQSQQHQ
ncbi:hypothetical protein BGX27_011379 [Mortierella sp. AM989]|nr:hypothetical protein BGX27_011379 [Mortierella sp. AM989]